MNSTSETRGMIFVSSNRGLVLTSSREDHDSYNLQLQWKRASIRLGPDFVELNGTGRG